MGKIFLELYVFAWANMHLLNNILQIWPDSLIWVKVNDERRYGIFVYKLYLFSSTLCLLFLWELIMGCVSCRVWLWKILMQSSVCVCVCVCCKVFTTMPLFHKKWLSFKVIALKTFRMLGKCVKENAIVTPY